MRVRDGTRVIPHPFRGVGNNPDSARQRETTLIRIFHENAPQAQAVRRAGDQVQKLWWEGERRVGEGQRLSRATEAIRDAIAAVSTIPSARILDDDDLVDDLGLDELELESLGLILEEIFGIDVPEEIWGSPLNRTPASLAEWCIRKSNEAAWREVKRQA